MEFFLYWCLCTNWTLFPLKPLVPWYWIWCFAWCLHLRMMHCHFSTKLINSGCRWDTDWWRNRIWRICSGHRLLVWPRLCNRWWPGGVKQRAGCVQGTSEHVAHDGRQAVSDLDEQLCPLQLTRQHGEQHTQHGSHKGAGCMHADNFTCA
jgi:hypothetical protein